MRVLTLSVAQHNGLGAENVTSHCLFPDRMAIAVLRALETITVAPLESNNQYADFQSAAFNHVVCAIDS